MNCFNLAIEMLIISGCADTERLLSRLVNVSISQSRCLSFQVRRCIAITFGITCFNLAIEMLIISGPNNIVEPCGPWKCFNLAIEMLIISGAARRWRCSGALAVSISQSRCLSFQATSRRVLSRPPWNVFQSRNRDAYHFREGTPSRR